MSDKIFNKLITLSVDELDNYIEFLESIYSPTITGKEIDKKTMEYLGITDPGFQTGGTFTACKRFFWHSARYTLQS